MNDNPLRLAVRGGATLLAAGSSLLWFFEFAYADWLRFSSPKKPELMTGQVVFEKAAKGVFYVTQHQHFWIDTMLLPIWLVGAFAMFLLWRTDSNSKTNEVSAGPPSFYKKLGILLTKIFGLIWFCGMMLLFWAGDYVMAFIFTGKLIVPPVSN